MQSSGALTTTGSSSRGFTVTTCNTDTHILSPASFFFTDPADESNPQNGSSLQTRTHGGLNSHTETVQWVDLFGLFQDGFNGLGFKGD